MALSRINAQSIADGTIIAADIADGSITTAKIADGNVTSAKIDTVANTKIAGVITTSQLANNLTVNASSIISSANIDFKVGASQNTAAKIDSNENLQFNSGYGSVATAYGCRAWVNFDMANTPTIRGSGNVSSITDENSGIVYVNFTNSMPDTNYTTTCGGSRIESTGDQIFQLHSTLVDSVSRMRYDCRVFDNDAPSASTTDGADCYAAVFR